MPNTLKIFYKAGIELKTALHIGTAQESPVGAFEIIKNGAGEFIIPGTSIAGVFFDTLRDMYDDDLHSQITEYEDNKGKKSKGSDIVFRSVNLGTNPLNMIRNRVKIDHETKTAENKALFSYWEIEPEGISFDLEIEIDNLSIYDRSKEMTKLAEWVEAVLTSWKNEGVFFGGHNTSGNGYCVLHKLNKKEITKDNYKAHLDNPDAISYNPISLNYKVNRRFKTWKITVDMTDEDGGYGTNALLIKGGASHHSLAGNPSDGVFVNTGKRLYIPGSSLKGTFSMFLEKYGKSVWLNKFFGQNDSKNQGYIYFPDLIFSEDVNDNKNHLVNIERHAEDEFTRAVFGSGKFNEERLFYAKQTGKIRVPLKFYQKFKTELDELISFMQKGCAKRLISLGANGCYPKITIEEGNDENN